MKLTWNEWDMEEITLDRLLDSAAAIFGKYELRRPIEHHWYPDEFCFNGVVVDEKFLSELQLPLSEISIPVAAVLGCEAEMLARVEDYKHFVPLLLSITAAGHYGAATYRRMRDRQFQSWPNNERAIISEALLKIFEQVLEGAHDEAYDEYWKEGPRADLAAAQFAFCVVPVIPASTLIERWQEREEPVATRLLVKAAIALADDPENFIDGDDEPDQVRLAEMLLHSTKVEHILRDRALAKQLGLVDTQLDRQRMRSGRQKLSELVAKTSP